MEPGVNVLTPDESPFGYLHGSSWRTGQGVPEGRARGVPPEPLQGVLRRKTNILAEEGTDDSRGIPAEQARRRVRCSPADA